ncbi:periplasmic chaperone for outer membrane proteins Skp [Fibrobacter sp. UWH9]|uniref:OmpH family outer membrane protein n=1 Tax=unclassified Fibrobacter TaxID=2634177 RepID=UPI00091A1C74|nr:MULTISPECIES: OmpH family outer membrane protein [Fibrobacter]MCL4103376.1 hypothetical protein [Fibrobacter succinogenes]SHH87960.1 periplasmic chaperone for outer membrane proteins Skp [Fibrobacter sp. UWH9]
MNKMGKIAAVLAVIISLAGIAYVLQHSKDEVRYGFVNTEKLLNSFVESQKALDEVQQAETKWNTERLVIEDSLKAFEARVVESYEKLSVAEKTAMKKEQVSRIEELGRFNQARANSIQQLRVQKLQNVYEKINAAMSDFAKKNGLDIVFATSNGSIVYGEGSKVDVTDDFLVFLNDRFK